MNRQEIKVSVIMACHNSSAYLDEAVNSVLRQTLEDLELILIDDCSTDDTLEIAKRYQKQDERVSVLSLPINSGPAIARNTGFRAARGEWIGILDSDDVAMPSRFKEQMRLAESKKDLVMIGSNFISINENGNPILAYKYPTGHQELVKRLYSKRAFPPHSSMIYRRNVVDKLSGFNKRYVPSEDYDLWLRLSEVGKINSIDKTLVKIRKHKRNISNAEGGVLQTRLSNTASVCHYLRVHGASDPSVYPDENLWQEFIQWIERRMTEDGAFVRRQTWISARSEFFANKNRLCGAFRFSTRLLQSKHANTLLREKFFGSSLPQRLAQEWMVQSGSA